MRPGAAVRDARTLELEGAEPLARLLREAHARGHAEGRDAGALEAAAQGAARLQDAAGALEEQADQLRTQAAATALELGLVIARELVLKEVARGEHDLEAMVRSALAEAGPGRGACVVHLNPADAAALVGVEFRAGTRIESDPGVRAGDVQVETAMGLVVRDLDACLQDLAVRLREELT